MTKPSPTTLAGIASLVVASLVAALVSYAVNAWGSTSESAVVSRTKVEAIEKRLETAEKDLKAQEINLQAQEILASKFGTHQLYIRQQVAHTEMKVDALLEHFHIPTPPEPTLPAED